MLTILWIAWLIAVGCRRPDKFRLCHFFCLSVGTGDRNKLVCTLIPPQRELNSLWVWEACFVADTHAMKSSRVWEACFVADTHAMESLRVWEACFASDTHAMESLRVWEACFVADTHTMKCLWVWEACFAADTQIVKNGRYNKAIIYSRMPAAGVRPVYDNPTLRAMHSIHKCVAKGAPYLLTVLRNEPRYS